jgi:hypothetical protein
MEKDYILKEIKRTAASNGGVPLGRQRFLQETGIKQSDWSGKFWARWNDAIREAGLEPNEMVSSLSDEFILESYALFIKEIGRIPTGPELRMKARQSEDFPNDKTFSKFGNKAEVLRKVFDFVQSKPEYAEILQLLKTATGNNLREEADENLPSEVGYVYLLRFGEEYKIGSSNNVERRFREIKTQMPYNGEIIHTIATGDPPGIEAYWHEYFSARRLKGEWFKLTKRDIDYFKRRKLM